MLKKNIKLIIIITFTVVLVSYLIHKSSPKINKKSEKMIIQPVSLIDKERDFSVYFVRSNIDTNKIAKFFSLTKKEIVELTQKFKEDIPTNSIAIPLNEE